MKCKKCGEEIDRSCITCEFLEESKTIDLVVTCPKCDARLFTFIQTDDLIEDV